MKSSVGSFAAKTHLSSLLERVSRGESFLITKRGKPVASLCPVEPAKQQGPKDMIDEFRKKFAGSLKKISLKEINELKSIGRK